MNAAAGRQIEGFLDVSHFAFIHTATFADPAQKIRGFFMTNGAFRIELLEPLVADSPLEFYLQRGIQAYHHAYEARDFSRTIARLSGAGHRLVVPPVHAVAFGRKIAFIMLRNMSLIEIIEPRASTKRAVR